MSKFTNVDVFEVMERVVNTTARANKDDLEKQFTAYIKSHETGGLRAAEFPADTGVIKTELEGFEMEQSRGDEPLYHCRSIDFDSAHGIALVWDYATISDLNRLAKVLSGLSKDDKELFLTLIFNFPNEFDNEIRDVINLALNICHVDVVKGLETAADVGRLIAGEREWKIPDELFDYIDWEQFVDDYVFATGSYWYDDAYWNLNKELWDKEE